MNSPTDKPGTPEELVLRHHGVKGMKWGVRNEDDVSEDSAKTAKDSAEKNASTKEYMAASRKLNSEPVSKEQYLANIKANQAIFARKFLPPKEGEEREKFTSTEKKVLIGLGLTAAVAGVAGGVYLYKRQGGGLSAPHVSDKLLDFDGDMFTSHLTPGAHVSFDEFTAATRGSMGNTWGHGTYIKDVSYTRPAMEFPVGHVFHRISAEAETEWRSGTYATPSVEDFHRYLNNFNKSGGDFYEVTWKATSPIKVPALPEVLDTMRTVVEEHYANMGYGEKVTPETVIKEYGRLNQYGWSTSDMAKSLVSKLSDKGYSAIVDEMDAGVLGEAPLVFFDKSKATAKSSKLITDAVRKESAESLTEIKWRK